MISIKKIENKYTPASISITSMISTSGSAPTTTIDNINVLNKNKNRRFDSIITKNMNKIMNQRNNKSEL